MIPFPKTLHAMNANPYAPPAASLDRPLGMAGDPPRLWNPDVAGLWSLLLTPVFGSAMVWMNWKALGESSRAQIALLWLAVTVLALFLIATVNGFGLIYLIIWYFGCQRPQTKYVKARWGDSYPRKSWLVPVLGTIGGIIALFAVLVVLNT